MAQKSKIWTTHEVNVLRERMKIGEIVKETPFFNNDPDLKRSNIIFEQTPEEFIEILKCSQNAIYFTTKYCNFLTDQGRKSVKLRSYQKNLLKVLTDEEYNVKINDVCPVNRDVILLQSRQTGKCFPLDTIATGKQSKLQIGALYKENRTVTYFFKRFLYKIYHIL